MNNSQFLSIIMLSNVIEKLSHSLIEKNIMGVPLRSTLDLNLKGSW